MEAEAEDGRDGAAVVIEGRVGDELVVERDVDAREERVVVVDLDVFLRAIVERTVAGEDADAAGGKIGLVGSRGTTGDEGEAERVGGEFPLLFTKSVLTRL